MQKVRNLQKVSVQNVVLNSLEPSTLPSQPLPELSHFTQVQRRRNILLMSLWFLLLSISNLENLLSSLRDKTNETSPINVKQSSFFRSQKSILRSSHNSFVQFVDEKSKTYEKWFDFPCHYTNSNPHDVLRAIKVLKEDEKYIVVGFRHLQ